MSVNNTESISELEHLQQHMAGMAHDFRNLLTIIMGQAFMLMRKPEMSEASKKQLQNMISTAERGSALAHEFVRQIAVYDSESTSQLVDIVETQLEGLRVLVGPTCQIDWEPCAAGSVRLPALQIERIVVNLVMNAREAMADGGTIRMATRTTHLRGADGATEKYLCLEVNDTGPGVPQELVDRVFDRYFTTKSHEPGRGLGLAIVREIAEQANGFIQVEPVLPHGSCFQIYFPEVQV